MRENLEQSNYLNKTEMNQKETKERESDLVLITIIDDDTYAWRPHQIAFKYIEIKNRRVFCEIFDDYNQDLENYLTDNQKEKNHFIIVDLSIGHEREGGLGIINKLRSLGIAAKIFLISGYDAQHISSDINVDRILAKPVMPGELVEYIKYYLKKNGT